ncbi:MAG: protein kinase [Polyangiaceae bacterium]
MENLGRYTLLDRLGVGAWSEVFKAKSFGVEGFEKTIVVKRLTPEFAADAAFVEDFVRAAKKAIRLSHANIAQVFDLGHEVGDAGHSYFLAGEFVAGVDLLSVLRSKVGADSLPLPLALFLVAQAAKALEHAHRRVDADGQTGVVHGALSPADVLLSFEGEVKLTDFCITEAVLPHLARTAPERLREKLPYLSPEVLRQEPATSASDIYALGALLLRMLAAEPPHVAEDADALRERIASGAPVDLSRLRENLAPELAELLKRCLEPSPERRVESAGRFYEQVLALTYALGARFDDSDLADWLDNVDLRARPATLPPLEEVFEEVEPEELVPSSRPLAADFEEASTEGLQTLGELPSERELTVLAVAFRAGPTRVEAVRMRARAVALRYGGRELESASAAIYFVFGLEPGDTRHLDNAARAGLVMLRAIGPLAEPAAALRFNTAVVHDGELDDAARPELVRSCEELPPTPAGALLATRAAAERLGEAFPTRPGPNAEHVFLEEPSQPQGLGPFLGRRSELRSLAQALSGASRGRLHAVAVVGPHGIGKTRLLSAATRRVSAARLDVGVYVATCPPRGRDVPWSGATAMLRALTGVRDGDALDGVLGVEPRLRALGLVDEETSALLALLGAGPAASPHAIETAFAKALASLCAERLHVLAWDDAHELDADSTRAIAFAMDRLERSQVAVVLLGREREPGALFSRPGLELLELGDLEREDASKLAALRLGVETIPPTLEAFLWERAGGHPMFIEELLREALASKALLVQQERVQLFEQSAALTVPRSLKMLVADRLRRLPDAERGLLVAAAILEPPADLAVVAELVELPVGVVHHLADSLIHKELLVARGTTHVGFASQLVRDVVLADFARDRAQELHVRAADALQIVLGVRTEELAAQIGHHLAMAGQADRAAGFFATSGFYHAEARRLDVAARHLMRALSLADLSDRGAEQIRQWVGALSEALHHVRAGEGLHELVRRLSGWLVLDKAIDGRLRGAIEIDLAVSLGALHRYKEARRLLQRAADSAAAWPELARSALLVDAELSIRQGEMRDAEAALQRAEKLQAADAIDEHRFWIATAQTCAGAGRFDDAIAALDTARDLVPEEDAVLSAERDKVRALVAGFRGDWTECARISALAAEEARGAGLMHEAAVNLHNQGDSLLRLDEPARAYAVLGASRALAEQIGSERMVNLNVGMMAFLDALKGDKVASDVLQRSIVKADSQKWAWDVVTLRYLLGRLHAARGDASAARRELSAAHSLASSADNRVLAQDCERALAELGSS